MGRRRVPVPTHSHSGLAALHSLPLSVIGGGAVVRVKWLTPVDRGRLENGSPAIRGYVPTTPVVNLYGIRLFLMGALSCFEVESGQGQGMATRASVGGRY